MTHETDFFKPDQVDEQVKQLARHSEKHDVSTMQSEEKLVEALQGYYQDEQAEDRASLERAWKRVANHLPDSHEHSPLLDKPGATSLLRFPQERTRLMPNDFSTQTIQRNSPEQPKTRGRRLLQRLSLVAAALIAALLVSSLVLVLNLSHQTTGTGNSIVQRSVTPTAKPLPPGTVIYTTPKSATGFTGLTWSPDSKRVATLTGNTLIGNTLTGNAAQIWDATTGAHLVTVPFSSSQWPTGITWAPNSQQVAIATSQNVLIVDGQTGHVLRTFAQGITPTPTPPTTPSPTPSSQNGLSSLFPASGYFGYQATAWAPDGKSIASTLTYGATSALQIWNPQTGEVDFTFQPDGSYIITAVAWSSDGQYIAMDMYHSWSSDAASPTKGQIIVWNTTTHQIVSTLAAPPANSQAAVVWQPGSHNLAFTTTSDNDQVETIEVRNALSGKLVTQYANRGSEILAWSPDGKDLAYAGYIQQGNSHVSAVIILDATTGQPIYAYKGSEVGVAALAWSPDGAYIVSAQEQSQQQVLNGQLQPLPVVATVWVA